MAGYNRTNCFLCGKKSEGLPHFRFPLNIVFRCAWANACNIDPASVTRSHKLCSRHFTPNDYMDFFYHSGESMRTRLKKDTVPSLGLPRFIDENDALSESYDECNNDSAQQSESAGEIDENHVDLSVENGADPDLVINDHIQLSELPSDFNVDAEKENHVDEDVSEINYDEYGEDLPAELNNFVDIQRFVKKKDRLLKTAALHNRRLKRRLAKLREEYLEFGDERGITLPDLDELELDVI